MDHVEERSEGFFRLFFVGFGAGCLLFVVYIITLVLLGEVKLDGTSEPPVSPDPPMRSKPPLPPTGYKGPGTNVEMAPVVKTPRPAKPAPVAKIEKKPRAQPASPRKNAEQAHDRGLEHLAASRYERAKAQFNQAVSADQKYAPAWRDLGLAYEKLGNKDMAQAAFSRYLSLDPTAPDADLVRQRMKNL